jgi:hypothetical protein
LRYTINGLSLTVNKASLTDDGSEIPGDRIGARGDNEHGRP